MAGYLTARRPPDRFICKTCGAVFLRAIQLIEHVEQYRDGDSPDAA